MYSIVKSARTTLTLTVAVLIVAACGTNAPDPAPAVPATPLAPAVTLSSSPTVAAPATPTVPAAQLAGGQGQTQQAVTGTACWGELGNVPSCTDPLALLAPTEPLVVAPREALRFALPDAPLAFVTLRVLAWQPAEGAAPPGQTLLAPDAPLAASGDLEPTPSIPWEAPTPSGDYLLDLTAVYRDGRSVSYGWHLRVQ